MVEPERNGGRVKRLLVMVWVAHITVENWHVLVVTTYIQITGNPLLHQDCQHL